MRGLKGKHRRFTKKEDFIEFYEGYEKFTLDPEFVWDFYHNEVRPYLSLITDFRLQDESTTEKELKIAFGINNNLWRHLKLGFMELVNTLNSKKSVMKFKAQLDLQKGMLATQHKNPKMVEMQLVRYDDEYKKKQDGTSIQLPEHLEFTITSAKKTDIDFAQVDSELQPNKSE